MYSELQCWTHLRFNRAQAARAVQGDPVELERTQGRAHGARHLAQGRAVLYLNYYSTLSHSTDTGRLWVPSDPHIR